ncbi:DUF2786 domain-containing protein [Streptomyces sp. UNOB3_S3]|uniref:DUF2786 domain-containing protein n=1 Tax=Streptomyces sp. UNOB3_S3 TaxID=2871682 RepID=UPI001E48E419|nr:DUF2786 domain-containing protein [Streptomyces sp. UNOB3_S3]MCC3779970.1 DUF2786 domain-containing protein [Streptomyces sp. UNOB3_S3]
MQSTASPLETVAAAVRGLRAAHGDDLDDAVYAAGSVLAAAPAGWEAISGAVVRHGSATVRRAWEYGWQPADIVRLVRRELPAAETRFAVALIAAEGRRYAPETLDARWVAQLKELDARAWWETDDTFLDGFAERERLSRFETAVLALGTLRLIDGLPRIGGVGPLPGTGGHVREAAAAAPPKMLGRVRALLAKAESTLFPEEAEALSAKAQELMARHSIDEALLAAGAAAAGDGPGACRIGVEGPYESAKALLLDAVAAANHCQAVWSSEYGFSTVVGFDADLELVELLYTSLLVQATTAMGRAADDLPRSLKGTGGTPTARGRSRRTRDFRESFLIAYAGRIGDRLSSAVRDVAAEETRPEVLPVLAARDVAVGETAGRLFPETTSHRLKGRDAEGWARGTEAADAARLAGSAQ